MFTWLSTLFKLLLSSKVTTLVAFVAAVFGALSNPQFAGVLPDNISAWLLSAGMFLGTLSRGLVDTNGNGIPDIIDHLLGRS